MDRRPALLATAELLTWWAALTATGLLAGGVGATVWGVATGPLRRRVVAQNLCTAFACPALLLLSQGYDRPSYVDLALVLALLGPVGTLVLAVLFTLGALGLAGLPPFGTALGKSLAEEAVGGPLTVLYVAASAVTAAAVLRSPPGCSWASDRGPRPGTGSAGFRTP
ncbi:monovalent cation/H+ antiporter complex subunit F [Streptomyces sp. SID13726]|uniref:monovalent cation/H+ antiporter complex subunit F n=1 Tax=Streptomyces sp. SID13726 TaxID=2706058 RepID=UPI001EF25557|nr:monovalent cation/H+ antiporter complex subunit F [Streptomyces sp. SID13726]